MSAARMNVPLAPPATRPLTGIKVLAWLVGFFGVVAGANGLLIHYAMSTFRGLDENNPYILGLSYNDQIAGEKAQDERGWKVDFSLRRPSIGQSEISVLQKDAQGVASTAIKAIAYFEHPSDRHRDISVALDDYGSGVYRQKTSIAPGAWDVILEMRQGDKQVFRSRNRVLIEEAPGR